MRSVLLLIALVGASCGDDAAPPSAPQPSQAQPAPLEESVPDPEPITPAESGAAAPVEEDAATEESAFGTITLETGFMPDPRKMRGETNGSDDAAILFRLDCPGWVTAARPDHILVAVKPFPVMRLLVHGEDEAPLTLILKKPDGTFLCSGAGGGADPILEAPLDAGAYAIWVGTATPSARARYTIGFSELTSTTAASLAD